MKILKFDPKKSKAQAIVEFALVLPVLLLVVYGLIEAGRLLFIYSSVTNVARQAARWGSTTGEGPTPGVSRYLDCKEIRKEAERIDFLNAFDANDDAQFVIEYDRPTSVDPDPGAYFTCTSAIDVAGIDAETGDRITVRVNADFTPILPLVPFDPFTINAESSRTLLLTISIQPPKVDTRTFIIADAPDPSEVGQSVTVSVEVTPVSGTTIPTGAVEITGADLNCTISNLDADGKGSCVVNFNTFSDLDGDGFDTRTLLATYLGDDKHNPSDDTETHSVKRTSTTTTITAHTPDPSLVGQTVMVEVNVENANPWGVIPGGPVEITGPDTTGCTITLSGGTGTCNLNFTATGVKTLTASYIGDSTHSASSDTATHNVIQPEDTITRITSHLPNPSRIGETVTVTFAVTGSSTPTGTVTITGQDQGCATPVTLSGGTGSCQVIFNSTGGKTLTATYTPDTPTFNGSQGTVSHPVELRPTSTTINTVAPDSPPPGTAITVSVTVVDLISASTIPTGTVVVSSGDVATICTIALSGGTGSCTGTIGTSKTLTATYTPNDGIHDSSAGTKTIEQPRVEGCNTTNITVGLMEQTGGAMTMTISNSLSTALQISNVTVQWNHDKGHQTGADKTLILQSARLGSVFWTGNQIGPTYTITPAAPTYIPSGVSTLIFNFHQVFDRWDNTESITINLSTPGCEGVILFQNQHD